LGVSEAEVREWSIRLEIRRGGQAAFTGSSSPGQIRRAFADLAGFLFRCQRFPRGAVLLTGTGVVPPDSFTLLPGDLVAIEISGVGRLENPVIAV
jgi:2-dehydro-3-deoxy-D-arabinonate dehydratase